MPAEVEGSAIDITQDCESYDGELGSNIDSFWSEGHGYDSRAFVRAVVDFCFDEELHVPRIDPFEDVPQELWQRVIDHGDSIEYDRAPAPTAGTPRKDWKPITLLDLDTPSRARGGRKCTVANCREPWSTSIPVRVADRPSEESDHVTVYITLCREHAKRLPGPSYRVFMVPVGATIMLPKPAEAAS